MSDGDRQTDCEKDVEREEGKTSEGLSKDKREEGEITYMRRESKRQAKREGKKKVKKGKSEQEKKRKRAKRVKSDKKEREGRVKNQRTSGVDGTRSIIKQNQKRKKKKKTWSDNQEHLDKGMIST